MDKVVDITPSTRILRTLGEIPFQPWQCIAELMDNAIDAFRISSGEDEKLISVRWSHASVAPQKRTLEVEDFACGMSIEQLQNAVRAGYSSNDPVSNLGLFGMGFNIATARLGDYTEVLTTKAGDETWIGLRLDFDALVKTRRFEAPVITEAKEDPAQHGTIIRISQLKPGIWDALSSKESEIRKLLQSVYSPLLRKDRKFSIKIKGKKLIPEEPCVWSERRYVTYNGKLVPAKIQIDHSFGTAYYDVQKNRYLTQDEEEELNVESGDKGSLPDNIILREKKVRGWIGIQRYANPDDFGIDLVRNGRKILMSDKSFFYFENPWTNTRELQYPVELGSTVGGRIIGELEVDYLLPTYQKNDFDRSDKSWHQLMNFLCGAGPFLPTKRKAMGYTDPIEAPLPLLANAFRRCDPGTKCLYVPKSTTTNFLGQFRKGVSEYLSDDLWFKAAQEADQQKNSGGVSSTVDSGEQPTDDVSDYLVAPGTASPKTVETVGTPKPQPAAAMPPTSSPEELLSSSAHSVTLSGSYSFGQIPPFVVKAYELKNGRILSNGISLPCYFDNKGINCTFIYNPRHIVFEQYPIRPKDLLLQYIAEKIKVRDVEQHADIVEVYVKLMQDMMPEMRIDKSALQERADAVFKDLRTRIADALSGKKLAVLNCIHEASGEVEETLSSLFPEPELLDAFQCKEESGYPALEYVPAKTILRLVNEFPEEIFDGKVFKNRYSRISHSDSNAEKRLREEAKDRMQSYLKDVVRLLSTATGLSKNDLTRCAISLQSIQEAMV